MSLTSGSRLGPYEIGVSIGAGGMGEVFRARDTRLGRDVAIKVLPASLAQDHDRVTRFKREAQVLASLNHPNIAAIYGLEETETPTSSGEAGRVIALILELVAGEDLSERLGRGALPVDEAIAIAREIVAGLEAAHEKGIIHRDLKPGNIKLAADGKVKILDFGLAKALDNESSISNGSTQLSHSPTISRHATEAGMILGTAAYMSPEQARGKPVDKRADIWAFGVVLFETLSGTRLFAGETLSDTLAAVLRQDVDWKLLPVDTPRGVQRLLRRCLERDPKKRLHDISDAHFDLDDVEPNVASASAPSTVITQAPSSSWKSSVGRVIAAVLVTAGVVAIVSRGSRSQPTPPLSRLSILAPGGLDVYPDSVTVAISPDGTKVAFVVGSVSQSDLQLWVRSLDSMTSTRLEGTEGASLPFWSPDSKRIGFFTSTKLKTIAASGGRAEILCDVAGGRGGAWTRDNTILFAPDASGALFKIPATGGSPVAVTKLDSARKEVSHRFPTLLPDDEHFLYASLPGKNGRFDIFAGSLKDDSHELIGTMDNAPVYAEPGWLVSSRQGVLSAQAFDARTRKMSGDPISLGDEPGAILDPAFSFTAGPSASVSRTGSLVYFAPPSANTIAVWVDTAGQVVGNLNIPPGHYSGVMLSPDGKTAALTRATSPSESGIWLADVARGGASPFSTGHGLNSSPVWSPDGTRVVFSGDRDGPFSIYSRSVGDAAPETLLYKSDVQFKNVASWSPDGKWMTLTQLDQDTAQNVWILDANGQGELRLHVRGPVRDNAGPFSPDGRWITYMAEDTGRFEVYAQSFPAPGNKVQISRDGGSIAWWTKDGRTMFFVDDRFASLWSVDVESGPTLRVGQPKKLGNLPANVIWIDAAPDRKRFLALVPEHKGQGTLTVVQNWRAAIK